jgi:hypothetical protein
MTLRRVAATLLLAVCAVVIFLSSPSDAALTCDRQLVMQVDTAQVSVEPDGFSIDIVGTSESAGWTAATLIVAEQVGDTATVDFVACRPEVAAQVLSPIKASQMLDLPLDTKNIVIRARTNSMTIEISGQ